jgi:hypothetical protein
MKAASTADLKALCLALLDNVNDKSVALSHQKQTNRLLAAKIGILEQKIRSFSGDASDASLLTPSQLLLDNYTSAKVDEDLRLPNIIRSIQNGELSESSRSQISSEFETQSTSDISSELKQLSYIKIVCDDDEDAESDLDSVIKKWEPIEKEFDDQLTELPPDIQKLVDEAMKSSETLEIQSKNLT